MERSLAIAPNSSVPAVPTPTVVLTPTAKPLITSAAPTFGEQLEEMPVGVETDREFDGHDPQAHDHSSDYRKGNRGRLGRSSVRAGPDDQHDVGRDVSAGESHPRLMGGGLVHRLGRHFNHRGAAKVALVLVASILVIMAGAIAMAAVLSCSARVLLMHGDTKKALLAPGVRSSAEPDSPEDCTALCHTAAQSLAEQQRTVPNAIQEPDGSSAGKREQHFAEHGGEELAQAQVVGACSQW